MAQIKCVRPFGNFTPGDTVDIPDGAEFTDYFEAVDAGSSNPIVPPVS